jgi:hypothetical protein
VQLPQSRLHDPVGRCCCLDRVRRQRAAIHPRPRVRNQVDDEAPTGLLRAAAGLRRPGRCLRGNGGGRWLVRSLSRTCGKIGNFSLSCTRGDSANRTFTIWQAIGCGVGGDRRGIADHAFHRIQRLRGAGQECVGQFGRRLRERDVHTACGSGHERRRNRNPDDAWPCGRHAKGDACRQGARVINARGRATNCMTYRKLSPIS